VAVHIRKARAGSASTGYVWPEDGAIVPVDDYHAAELLTIPDGGFSIAEGIDVSTDDPGQAAAKPAAKRRAAASKA
jgi:hypothetical protein